MSELARGPQRIAEIVPVLYAAVDRRLWPAAAHSVWAHVLRLARLGAVEAEGPPTLQAVYRSAEAPV